METRGVPPVRRRLSRRRFSALLGLGAVAATGLPIGRRRPAASAQDVLIVDPETEQRTESIGESAQTVWVEATGHTMSSVLLDYWRATGRDELFGNPISEPFETPDGIWSQAMEAGIIQYLPEYMWTLEPFVRFMPAGRMLLADLNGGFRGDGKRMGGGGNPRAGAWALPEGSSLSGVVGYAAETAVEVAEPFRGWYLDRDAAWYLGQPLTPLITERGRPAQWFEGGLLLEEATGPKLAPLGAELAARLDLDTTPVEQGDLPVDDESVFLTVPNPFATGNAAGPGRKRIDVDVTDQQVRLFAGETMVLESFISTGLWPNKTELGNFRVRYKKRLEDMRGATDEDGAVVWIVGEGGSPPPGSIPYGVSDVPDVLYINQQAEALHGAYWHNNFGETMSHGCINQPLDVAAFVYDWAPLGTPVRVLVHDGEVYPGSENATPKELAEAAEDALTAGGLSSPFAVGGA